MSDTGSPRSTTKGRGCALKVAAAVVVLLLLFAAHLGRYAYRTESAPLPFEPFRWRPLERSLLEGKFDFLEAAGKLFDRSAEVRLDERELNALLFGDSNQTPDLKERILIQGEHLVVEFSKKLPEGAWQNLRLELKVALGPGGLLDLQLVDARVGELTIDPVVRAMVQSRLRSMVADQVALHPRLKRVNAAYVRDGRLMLVYDIAK